MFNKIDAMNLIFVIIIHIKASYSDSGKSLTVCPAFYRPSWALLIHWDFYIWSIFSNLGFKRIFVGLFTQTRLCIEHFPFLSIESDPIWFDMSKATEHLCAYLYLQPRPAGQISSCLFSWKRHSIPNSAVSTCSDA